MPNRPEHLDALEGAILIKHKCKPTHKGTVYVHEQTEEKETIWEGSVEEFGLIGHKKAKTCYAWHCSDSQGAAKIFTVLGNHLIDSAKRAVQAAIFVGAQQPLPKLSRGQRDYKRQLEEFGNVVHETAVNDIEAG